MSRIGQLFTTARRDAGMTPKEVALAAGYRNVNKGLRRLRTLESGQSSLPDPRIVETFAAVLSIDGTDIATASELDWQELDRPIKPYLVERLMPAVYRRHELPEDCSLEDARSMAARMAAETRRSFCLVLSRVRSVYFYPSGNTRESNYLPGTPIGRYKALMAAARAKLQGRP